MNKNYSYRSDIVKSLAYLMCDYSCHRHSKTFFLRFDVRFPVSYNEDIGNNQIKSLMKYLTQRYKYRGDDPAYIWVRETHSSIHPHYHCLLLLDGQKVCYYNGIFEYIESKWQDVLSLDNSHGLIERCLNNPRYQNGVNIRRCDEGFIDTLQNAFEWMLYLAKDYSKNTPVPRMRCFNTSRYIQRDCRWQIKHSNKWNFEYCPIYQYLHGNDLHNIFPAAFIS